MPSLATILRGISLVTRFGVGLSHSANISLSIAFKTTSILLASAVMILKHLLTTYFTDVPAQTTE